MLALLNRVRLRQSLVSITAALLALGGFVVAHSLLTHPIQASPRVDNVSGRPLACLAYDTPSDPKAREPVPDIWASMQKTARTSSLNVQQLGVPSGATTAQSYLTALAARHCKLIITVGPRLGNAATTIARHSPGLQFLIADGPSWPTSPNITTAVGPTTSITSAVTSRLLSLR